MSSLTPMMQQYSLIKKQHNDCILFFRLGDFYEMFFEDAEIASRELEITLTGRECGFGQRAPMCGVPFHSADGYIFKLISKGHKVAICEQLEDPSMAKGLVSRDVVRIVTPGTITDPSMLDDKKNNFLMVIYRHSYYFGIAAADLSTGEFHSTQLNWGNTISKLLDEISKYNPSEIAANSQFLDDKSLAADLYSKFHLNITRLDDHYFQPENARKTVDSFFNRNGNRADTGIFDDNDAALAMAASAALLSYLQQTQKADLIHIGGIHYYKVEEYMSIDSSTRRNLELTETIRSRSRKHSLLWVLDRTMTSMGSRLLSKWIGQPLLDVDSINARLEAVSELKDKLMPRNDLRELLKKINDIERLMTKLVVGSINCRDLVSLKNSLEQLPKMKNLVAKLDSRLNTGIYNNLDTLDDVFRLIDSSIIDNPPVAVNEGGIIKDGFNDEVDNYRKASMEGKDWIASLENDERTKTGIKNLRISFNKVFGYYIEVTKSNYHLVPHNYIRKQTLANCERFITQELKDLEEKILGAEEKLIVIEYDLFAEIKEQIAGRLFRIRKTAEAVSVIDVLCALAETAEHESYCRPVVNDGADVRIIEGRHPVVEKMLGSGNFVPNDTFLDMNENRLNIITGPNMAGKSTYIRQVALIMLMTQIGSFVPAKSAETGIIDRIFTRVGASDDIAAGQSTFMVEMSEVAHILKNATQRSLLILDEIGRGTSTFDGLSIAWAVIEYICDTRKIGARTLFATHYHELAELEGKIPGIKNYCFTVREKGEDVVFLRKIINGKADNSYGIQVAKLAGLPASLLERAREILHQLEDADISKKDTRQKKNRPPLEGQIDIFALSGLSRIRDDVLDELKTIDIQTISPLDALNILYRIQRKAKGMED